MNNVPAIVCPLCNDKVNKLLYRFHLNGERQVIEKIRQQNPAWSEHDGACSRCVDYYRTELLMQQRILPEIGPHFPVRSADDFVVLPTGLRLDADQRFTGKGITICLIDSGFYPHPDITAHKNRIVKMVDITNGHELLFNNDNSISSFNKSSAGAWHGTMTTVVCAGDGYLSKGLYKGIASDAGLVLLKVQNEEGRITTNNIVKALEWVLQHHRQYGIRIVNMSISDDEAISFKQSEVDRLAEQLVVEGVVVVAAVGNDENGTIKPPANSPNVIAVGGLDDDNSLEEPGNKLYHSSFGKTVDGLMKPELVAHAIWIAAPILPCTEEQKEAELLYNSLSQSVDQDIDKESVRLRIQAGKYISPHYMHVDGTSFAAPIVSSIIAQLLEINPELTPAMIRHILFHTAKRLGNWPAERQGFGMIHAKKAVLKILNRPVMLPPASSPAINNRQNNIVFYLQDDEASQVSLAGSFNCWEQDALLLEPGMNGVWKIEIPMLPAGRYQYKFFVDDRMWLEDINNPWREPDGFNGFNSILTIEN